MQPVLSVPTHSVDPLHFMCIFYRSISSVIAGADAVVSALGYSGFNLGALDSMAQSVFLT